MQILDLIDSTQTNSQTPYTDVFIGGFSQGGCLSLHLLRNEFLNRLPTQMRGIFSIGSFLVKESVVMEQRVAGDDASADLPIFMMHGKHYLMRFISMS
jgi:predicted esterase